MIDFLYYYISWQIWSISCVISWHACIGVGASTFLGLRKIFARISPGMPEKTLGHFYANIFSWRPFFGWLPKNKVFMWFWTPFLTIFYGFCTNFQKFWIGFRRFCPDFHRFCPDFQGFCRDIHQIRTFGGALALPAPRLIHHCIYGNSATLFSKCRKNNFTDKLHKVRSTSSLNAEAIKNRLLAKQAITSWEISKNNYRCSGLHRVQETHRKA